MARKVLQVILCIIFIVPNLFVSKLNALDSVGYGSGLYDVDLDSVISDEVFWTGVFAGQGDVWVNLSPLVNDRNAVSHSIRGTKFAWDLLRYDLYIKEEVSKLLSIYGFEGMEMEAKYRVWLNVFCKRNLQVSYSLRVQGFPLEYQEELNTVVSTIENKVRNSSCYDDLRRNVFLFFLGREFGRYVGIYLPSRYNPSVWSIDWLVADYNSSYFSDRVIGGISLHMDVSGNMRDPEILGLNRRLWEKTKKTVFERVPFLPPEEKLELIFCRTGKKTMSQSKVLSNKDAEEFFLWELAGTRLFFKVFEDLRINHNFEMYFDKIANNWIETVKRGNLNAVAALSFCMDSILRIVCPVSEHFAWEIGSSLRSLLKRQDSSFGRYLKESERKILWWRLQESMLVNQIHMDAQNLFDFPSSVPIKTCYPFLGGVMAATGGNYDEFLYDLLREIFNRGDWRPVELRQLWGYVLSRKYKAKESLDDILYKIEVFLGKDNAMLLFEHMLLCWNIDFAAAKDKPEAVFLKQIGKVASNIYLEISKYSKERAARLFDLLFDRGDQFLLLAMMEEADISFWYELVDNTKFLNVEELLFIFSSMRQRVGSVDESLVGKMVSIIEKRMKFDNLFLKKNVRQAWENFLAEAADKDLGFALSLLSLVYFLSEQNGRYHDLLFWTARSTSLPSLVIDRAVLLLPDAERPLRIRDLDVRRTLLSAKKLLKMDTRFKEEILQHLFLLAIEGIWKTRIPSGVDKSSFVKKALSARFVFDPYMWMKSSFSVSFWNVWYCSNDYLVVSLGHEVGHNLVSAKFLRQPYKDAYNQEWKRTERKNVSYIDEMISDVIGARLLKSLGRDPISLWKSRLENHILDDSDISKIYRRNLEELLQWMLIGKDRLGYTLERICLYLFLDGERWFSSSGEQNVMNIDVFYSQIKNRLLRGQIISRRKFLKLGLGVGIGIASGYLLNAYVREYGEKIVSKSEKNFSNRQKGQIPQKDNLSLSQVKNKDNRQKNVIQDSQEQLTLREKRAKKSNVIRKKGSKLHKDRKYLLNRKRQMMRRSWWKKNSSLNREQIIREVKAIAEMLALKERNRFLWFVAAQDPKLGIEMLDWILQHHKEWLGLNSFLPANSELKECVKMTADISKQALSILKGTSGKISNSLNVSEDVRKLFSSLGSQKVDLEQLYLNIVGKDWKRLFAVDRKQSFVQFLSNPFWVFPVVVAWKYMRIHITSSGKFSHYYTLAEIFAFAIKEGYDRTGKMMQNGKTFIVTNELPMGLDRFGSNFVRKVLYKKKWLPSFFESAFVSKTGKKMKKNVYPLIYFRDQGVLGSHYPALLAMIAMIKQDEEEFVNRRDINNRKMLLQRYYKLPEYSRTFIRYLLYNSPAKEERDILSKTAEILINDKQLPSWLMKKEFGNTRYWKRVEKALRASAICYEVSYFTKEKVTKLRKKGKIEKLLRLGTILISGGISYSFFDEGDSRISIDMAIRDFLNRISEYEGDAKDLIRVCKDSYLYKMWDLAFEGFVSGRRDKCFKEFVSKWVKEVLTSRDMEISSKQDEKNTIVRRRACEELVPVHLGDWLLRLLFLGHDATIRNIVSQKNFFDWMSLRIRVAALGMALWKSKLSLKAFPMEKMALISFVWQLDHLVDPELLMNVYSDLVKNWKDFSMAIGRELFGDDIKFLESNNSFLVVGEYDNKLFLFPLANWVENYANLSMGGNDDFDNYVTVLRQMIGVWGSDGEVVSWARESDLFCLDCDNIRWVSTISDMVECFRDVKRSGYKVLSLLWKTDQSGRKRVALVIGLGEAQSDLMDEINWDEIVQKLFGQDDLDYELLVGVLGKIRANMEFLDISRWIIASFHEKSQQISLLASKIEDKYKSPGGILLKEKD